MSTALTFASVVLVPAPEIGMDAVYPERPLIAAATFPNVPSAAKSRFRFSPPGPPVTDVVSVFPEIVSVAAVPVPVYLTLITGLS